MGLGLGVGFRALAQLAPEQGRAENGQADLDRHDREGDKRQQAAVERHDDDVDHREDRIQDGGQPLAGEEVADLLQLGHAGGQVADGSAIEIVQRQPQQVVDHLGPQPHVDAVRRLCEQEGAQTGEQTFQQGDHHQGDAQNLEGIEAALRDHLVDDHLNQQRIHQSEQLHHQGCQQHLGQDAAIAADRGQEPDEVEPLLGR